MSPKFVQCSYDKVDVIGSTLINSPVNLGLCICFTKAKYAPNAPSGGAYAISFDFVADGELKWVYPNEEARDEDYNRILEGVLNS